MDRRADIVVTAADDTPQLVVEVKNRTDATPEWAAKLRRNLLSHGAVPHTPYFMVALPDRFFLWNNTQADWSAPADYVVDAADLLRPYSGAEGGGGALYSGYALELMIRSWLNDLLRAERIEHDGPLAWLVDSGLYNAIRRGAVRAEANV